ncbi:efflux RND transporter periplasmic adaptor subunit [Oceanirhabdus sp. W0125-5]|uniref:efflux RND transporter periplasmic adaptor subunit n=1 Tax=Oceanirhabdus sp. W0125-5 TaxID=2999116 RepID=UPI0022F3449E|nr:HlyD family efflux transporter periplasmic adaptor subunit [Oceanirhabdus sp. W0125-5]WBW97831.1 efflux RND transporter periplasmic adaptor subunit [Oceanirhabdus sp. W0125-5]
MIKERKKVLAISIILLLIMNLTSCGSMIKSKKKQPILLTSKELKFITEKAIKMDIDDKIEVDGRVDSYNSERLSFEKIGYLTYYNVYMGKEVKKGELLAALDIEDIDFKIKVLELKVKQDKIKIEIAKESGDALKIKDSEIELELHEMELDKLYDHRENYCLISGIDGIVSSYNDKNLGSKVNENESMINIMDTNALCIKFLVDEEDVKRVEIGDRVQVCINDEIFESEITDINKRVITSKLPDELNGKVTPLSTVKVQKVFKQIKDAILVPKTGIYTDKLGVSTVQVIEDGRIITKEIELGEEVLDYYQVLKGIEEGEEILVK